MALSGALVRFFADGDDSIAVQVGVDLCGAGLQLLAYLGGPPCSGSTFGRSGGVQIGGSGIQMIAVNMHGSLGVDQGNR